MKKSEVSYRPEPFPETDEGHEQAVAWVKNSGMGPFLKSWQGGKLLLKEVFIRKVNLMRGCWG